MNFPAYFRKSLARVSIKKILPPTKREQRKPAAIINPNSNEQRTKHDERKHQ